MQKVILVLSGLFVALVVVVATVAALSPRGLIVLDGFGVFWGKVDEGSHVSPAMVNVDGATIGGPFELTAHTGERVDAGTVIDRPTLIYFGYTFCPDICPIDTQIMVDAVDLLDEKGIDVKPVFITIDPERDTPKELSYFAEAVHPKLLALTGTKEEIRSAADAYKVFYQRVDLEESSAEYLMNHTGFTYLMTPEKGITALFRRDFPPEQIANDVEKVLETLGG